MTSPLKTTLVAAAAFIAGLSLAPLLPTAAPPAAEASSEAQSDPEPPPAAPEPTPRDTETAAGTQIAGLDWHLEGDTWVLEAAPIESRYLVIHQAIDGDPPADGEPLEQFGLDLEVVNATVSLPEGKVTVFEVKPKMLCHKGICLPCGDWVLCSFPPTPPEPPDGRYDGRLMRGP